MEPKKVVALRLYPEQYAALADLAQASSRTIPAYIRQVIKYYLNHPEMWNIN